MDPQQYLTEIKTRLVARPAVASITVVEEYTLITQELALHAS